MLEVWGMKESNLLLCYGLLYKHSSLNEVLIDALVVNVFIFLSTSFCRRTCNSFCSSQMVEKPSVCLGRRSRMSGMLSEKGYLNSLFNFISLPSFKELQSIVLLAVSWCSSKSWGIICTTWWVSTSFLITQRSLEKLAQHLLISNLLIFHGKFIEQNEKPLSKWGISWLVHKQSHVIVCLLLV